MARKANRPGLLQNLGQSIDGDLLPVHSSFIGKKQCRLTDFPEDFSKRQTADGALLSAVPVSQDAADLAVHGRRFNLPQTILIAAGAIRPTGT